MKRKMEIIRRATEVFEKKGVGNTSMGDIAKSIGIKREALYYYFKNRNDILLEIILPQSENLLSSLKRILAQSVSAEEKLFQAVENHISSFNPGYLEMTVAVREQHFIEGTSPKIERLKKTWDEYSGLWTHLIADGQESGEFLETVDAKVAAYGILGACNWLSRWYDPEKEISLSSIQSMYGEIFSRGLRKDPDGAPH